MVLFFFVVFFFADRWKQLQHRQHMRMSDSFFSPFALNSLMRLYYFVYYNHSTRAYICINILQTGKNQATAGQDGCHYVSIKLVKYTFKQAFSYFCLYARQYISSHQYPFTPILLLHFCVCVCHCWRHIAFMQVIVNDVFMIITGKVYLLLGKFFVVLALAKQLSKHDLCIHRKTENIWS